MILRCLLSVRNFLTILGMDSTLESELVRFSNSLLPPFIIFFRSRLIVLTSPWVARVADRPQPYPLCRKTLIFEIGVLLGPRNASLVSPEILGVASCEDPEFLLGSARMIGLRVTHRHKPQTLQNPYLSYPMSCRNEWGEQKKTESFLRIQMISETTLESFLRQNIWYILGFAEK